MFETTGSLAIVQPVLTLVGLVALPLLWTLVALGATRPTAADTDGAREGFVGPTVAISAAMGTLGLAVVLAVRLALLPRGYVLFQHVAQLGRLGQLDLALDLSLDPRSATFAVIVALTACGSVLHTAWSRRPGRTGILGWTGLVSTGAMLLCAGDGFATILVGLGLLSLGIWGLSRGGEPAPNATSLAGNASILLGLVFLFWSLGGAFGPEGYDPDGAPRFVLVANGAESSDSQKATLSMTTHAGALVSSDDADLPREPVSAPFAITVEPGVYTLRVQGGAASGDVVVPRVALAAGRAYVLTPYGPTASLRVLDDQVAVPRLAVTGGPAAVRIALATRTIGGLRASAIVLLLLLGGALAHAHALANRGGPSAVASVLEAVPAGYLALRVASLVDPTSADGALVAVLGAGSAIVIASRAACVDDGHRALRAVVAAVISVAVAAVGLGELSAALVLACSAVTGGAGALAAIDARRDVRWLGVAAAAVVGLLPGAGASAGFMHAVSAALASAASGAATWAAFAAGVALALVAVQLLAGLAAFRVYDALIRASVRDPGPSRGQGAVSIGLAVFALAAGTSLGAGTDTLGGSVVPLARRIVGSSLAAPSRPLGIAAVVLSIVSAALGVVLARRASLASSPPRWLLAFGRPYAILVWAAGAVAHAAGFLQRSVRALDRDVVQDVPAAAREVVLRLAGVVKRSDRALAARVDRSIEPAAGAALVKLEIDGPHGSERAVTIALLAMVALLGAVVLSSFLLH